MKSFAAVCYMVVLAASPAVLSAQQTYVLFDLTGGHFSSAVPYGISNVGAITGFGILAGNRYHAFVYRNGTFQDLGTLGYNASVGEGINQSGELAVNGEGPGSTAFLYSNGTATPVGTIDGGYTTALAINDLGDIVGTAVDGDGNRVGFSYIAGVFGQLGAGSVLDAYAINDSDQFAGTSVYYWTYGGYVHTNLHAFLNSNGAYTDLGSLAGDPRTNTEAFGINSSGDVVGYSTAPDGLEHAFLYASGSLQDLGTIASDFAIARAINDHGLIVGNLQNPYGASLGAFVYANGVMTDLSTLLARGGAGWSQLTVTGVDNNGAIIGYGNFGATLGGFLALPAGTAFATTLSLTSATGAVGSPVTLTATMKQPGLGLPVGGEPIQFSVDGANVGAPVNTDPTGRARLKYTVPEGTTIGVHSIAAAFAGDAYFMAASASGTLSVGKGKVKIAVHKATGAPGSTITLSATLKDAAGVPLSGETLDFTVAGASAGSGVTNGSGQASVSYGIPSGAAPGAYSITVTFAGNVSHLAGSGAATLTVN